MNKVQNRNGNVIDGSSNTPLGPLQAPKSLPPVRLPGRKHFQKEKSPALEREAHLRYVLSLSLPLFLSIFLCIFHTTSLCLSLLPSDSFPLFNHKHSTKGGRFRYYEPVSPTRTRRVTEARQQRNQAIKKRSSLIGYGRNDIASNGVLDNFSGVQ